ncbi:scavenger receptor class B member 1 isoform X2 [Anabrus simplex]|uniref:scavenger receptor class B member 1 isoform X2 n=1 Tax=Anabrus simplex TaxID=316456 RepID=UPI0035A32B5A
MHELGVIFLIVGGILNMFFGIVTFIWTPFDVLMNERLKMVPGLPPFDWWKTPPDEVFLRVYVFNVTNGPQFLNGTDEKLKFEEIGPFVFLEKLQHDNVTFNDNSTMTYTATRTAIFRPELTNVDLNATLILPNLAVLGISSYLENSPFFAKIGFKFLLRRLDSKPFTNITVYNYFWNYTDPLLHTARKLAPFLVPVSNMGILNRIYSDFRDEVTVYIGPQNGRRFFNMDRFHGSPRFGYWSDERCDAVQGATEGVSYPQFLTRNDSLLYFRKTICRITPIYYVGDVVKEGMDAFRFELPDDIYDRYEDPEGDCFAGEYSEPLPSGLSDLSPCYYGFPIAASNPHFLYGDPSLIDNIEGMKPERSKHISFAEVEPTTGVPMESCARSQSNLVLTKLTGLPRSIEKFSGLVLPMFWAEYHQMSLPPYIYYLIYFTVMILPDLQAWMSVLMLIGGGGMLTAGTISVVRARRSKPLASYNSLDLGPSTSSSDC